MPTYAYVLRMFSFHKSKMQEQSGLQEVKLSFTMFILHHAKSKLSVLPFIAIDGKRQNSSFRFH